MGFDFETSKQINHKKTLPLKQPPKYLLKGLFRRKPEPHTGRFHVLGAFLPKWHLNVFAPRSFSQLHPRDKLGICGQLTAQSCQVLWEGPDPSQRCHLTDTSGHHWPPKIVTGALRHSEVQPRPHSSALLSASLGHWGLWQCLGWLPPQVSRLNILAT